ncbi:MAG TPA: protein kinase [Gemmatimonadales bacterium]|nr:protein kinase [Gemmatimonadales bacterium]
MADTFERLQLLLGDRYEFVRELGRGGMATVFLAKDLKHERDVAVKVLHPDLAASIGGERFEREIRVAAKLQHPHILGMYDSGNADGLLYYVMPFIEGESLRDKIDREGQLPVEEAIRIALEVSDALGYAHKQNIVHRDIKPENVLLNDGRALVADFGIARAVEEGTQKLTQTGMALGTPTYMAPEQAMGEKVGPTADIYSLGCMLFEMLSGEPPFSGKNASAIMAKHVMEQVPSIRIVRQSVPEEIELAIFAAMGKSPADRPQTCADFSELLLAMPSGHTSTRMMTMRHTTARRVPGAMTATYQVEALPTPFWKRPVVMVPLVLALVGGGFAATKFLGAKQPAAAADLGGLDPKQIAVLYFQDATGTDSLSLLADGLTESVIQALAQVQGLGVISPGGVEQFRGNTAIGVDSIGHALQAGTIVRGTVNQDGGKLRVTVSLLDGNSGAPIGDPRSFTPSSGDLTVVRDSTAEAVATLIRDRLGEQVRLRQQRQGTTNTDAWLLVQRAERLRRALPTVSRDSLAAKVVEGDALLAQAEALDPKWVDVPVARAQLAYEHSRQLRATPALAEDPIRRGIEHADRAIAIDLRNANAYEVRGNLRTWRWALKLEADPRKAELLLADARKDLEQAKTLNPGQAGAWASLSFIYYQVDDATLYEVNEAAQRAWQADAFLTSAETVLTRLYLSTYDIGNQWSKLDRWCGELERRFPTSYHTPRCRLFSMTAPSDNPDVALAWRLADSVVALAPEANKGLLRLSSNLLVGAVLARAKLADSARAVVERSTGNTSVDPTGDLGQFAAFVYVLLDDQDAAIRELTRFLALNPSRRKSLATTPGWWYEPIARTPAFKSLVGST